MDTIDDRALDALLELIGGDIASLRRLVATFAEETDDIVRTMRRAVREGDVRALHRGAHTIRTGARYVGASRLEALATRMESRTVDADASFGQASRARAAREIEALAKAFDDAREALARRVTDVAPS